MDDRSDRRRFLKVIGVVGAGSLAGCTGNSGNSNNSEDSSSNNSSGNGADKSVEWTLGTGSEGGASYVIGSSIASFMQQNNFTDTVKLNPVETAGTLASYRKLDQGRFQMSGTNGPFLQQSPNKGPFEQKSLKNFDKIRQLRAYFVAQGFVATKKDSNIHSFTDLKGKTVYICPSGSGGRPLFELVFDETIGLDNIETRYDSWSKMPKLLNEGNIDAGSAFIIDNKIRTSHVQRLDALTDWRPLSFPKSLQKAMRNYPAELETLDAGWSKTYSGKVDVSSDPYIYVSRSDYSADAAYAITKIMYENNKKLASRNKQLTLFEQNKQCFDLLSSEVPVHEGTYKYLKEQGVWKQFDLKKPPEVKS